MRGTPYALAARVPLLSNMHYIPEVAPLLPLRDYEIKVSFILPPMLDDIRARHGGSFNHYAAATAYADGGANPVSVSFSFPDSRANTNYTYVLGQALRDAGFNPDTGGYIVLENRTEATFPLPEVLRTIGHWVAFMNDRTYVVTPSNVQFNSARLDYGKASPALLLDYFGLVMASNVMDTHVVIINPYVGAVEGEAAFFDGEGRELGTKFSIPPFSTHRIALGDIAAARGHASFRGNARITANHRVIPFFFFWNRAHRLYYSADHTIAWVNRSAV